ncbi:7-carboxy-7-deazaguanine synthase QueE [Methanogenium organophilum]|uniref:7-carboxy-7-deazaguanine synthase n=1 Tax=Methanogenium organophilum TaxID=2199 RepID=A0A9X9S1S6_METOG|nr:radical SAM protein [Methanogenium organophilum]WAI00284.1 radical SAM protein [Methanogenium organophilum]
MKIIEIFSSISGEGLRQGLPATFIRCAGCNLNCVWCDTPESHGEGTDMTIREIVSAVSTGMPRYVIITGGEPLLQEEELKELLVALRDAGYRIEIETNGTLSFTEVQEYATISMDIKCPSSGEVSDPTLLADIREEDAVKFVVMDRTDCLYAQGVIESHDIAGTVFISPVWGGNYREIADFILDEGIAARFQLQLHKSIGMK